MVATSNIGRRKKVNEYMSSIYECDMQKRVFCYLIVRALGEKELPPSVLMAYIRTRMITREVLVRIHWEQLASLASRCSELDAALLLARPGIARYEDTEPTYLTAVARTGASAAGATAVASHGDQD